MDLGSGPNGSCKASAVNDSGQVAGWTGGDITDDAEAFVWQDGVFTLLGFLAGATSSEAIAINQRGHVAGISDGYSPFFWNGETMTNLDPLANSISIVTSLNDNDEVVGYLQPQFGESTAVRFANGTHVSLYDEVSEKADWASLDFVTSINDDGAIVGWGHKGRNSEEPFLLIPQ